jgi:parallel beta-helix repeat protein
MARGGGKTGSSIGGERMRKMFCLRVVGIVFTILFIISPSLLFAGQMGGEDTTMMEMTHNLADSEEGRWEPVTVDAGQIDFISLVLDTLGLPAISYYDTINQDLRFAQWTGTDWQKETVDSAGNVGLTTSLAFDTSGNPAIAYYDLDSYLLKYAHWNGETWDIGTVENVGSAGMYGGYCYRITLKFDSLGYPAIAYYTGEPDWDLKYAHYDGLNWNTEVVHDDRSHGGWGRIASLAFDGVGRPAIAFRDPTHGIYYAHWDGSVWATERIDTGYGTGAHASLEFDSYGNPAIAYNWQEVFEGPTVLKYAYFDNYEWHLQDVCEESFQPSLAFSPSAFPAISYYDRTFTRLNYTLFDGSTWIHETIDTDVGERFSSLVFDSDGIPSVCYISQTTGELRYATRQPTRVWTVDDDLIDFPDADFIRIQDAVDAAGTGDVINVYPGTYIENVVVEKSIKIESVAGPQVTTVQPLISESWSWVFLIKADHVTVSGFTVSDNTLGSGIKTAGDSVNPVEGCRINSNIVANNRYGINLAYSDSTIVSDNDVTLNDWYAILVYRSSGNTISNNRVVDNIGTSATALGVSLMYSSSSNLVSENYVSNNDGGIWLFESCTGNEIMKNQVEKCYIGMRLATTSSANTLTENTLEDNAWGLDIVDSSDNTIYLNNFINSGASSNSANFWNSPEAIAYNYGGRTYTNYLGNYWSDYEGVDANGDGIGDTPHLMDFESDYYPLMLPFENYLTTNQPPLAEFTYTPLKPLIGELVTFDASSSEDRDGQIALYRWNFSDGTIYEGTDKEQVSHSFSPLEPQFYTVTLTVWDDEGASASKSKSVFISGEWSFAIVTDIHMGYTKPDYGANGYDDRTGGPSEDYFLTERLRGIVSWINNHPEIHFVVVLGDIADTAEYSEFLTARDILNGLDVPYIPLIGNHDVWPYTQPDGSIYFDLRFMIPDHYYADHYYGEQYFEEVFWNTPMSRPNTDLINHLFGNSWERQMRQQPNNNQYSLQNYAWTYRGIKFLALDFVDRSRHSGGPELHKETATWLRIKLEQDESTILLSHHPILLSGFDFGYSEAEDLNTIFDEKKSNILSSFAGHNHRNRIVPSSQNLGFGIPVVTTEAICRESQVWPQPIVGRTGNNIRLVTFQEGEPPDYESFHNIGDETEDIVTLWNLLRLKSPADLIITDPDGITFSKWTGDVPGMHYFEFDLDYDGKSDDVVVIEERKVGDYIVSVVPDSSASSTDIYTLEVMRKDAVLTLAENVQICDIPEQPYIVRVTDKDMVHIISARIDLSPDTLNLQSEGKWVTAYIELPAGHGYSVSDIDLDTILLNGQVQAESWPCAIGDYDEDGVPDLMVKFDRALVCALLDVGEQVTITISGRLLDGRLFEGTDMIRVIRIE